MAENFERTTFADLAALLLQDYRINARKSLERVTGAVKHLKATFDDKLVARDITEPTITAYIEARQAAGAANATINQELAALRRMFRLGERVRLVAARPARSERSASISTRFDSRAAMASHLPAPTPLLARARRLA